MGVRGQISRASSLQKTGGSGALGTDQAGRVRRNGSGLQVGEMATKTIFRCAVASLYEVVSVRPSVRRSVGPSPVIFKRVLGASCAVYPALFLFNFMKFTVFPVHCFSLRTPCHCLIYFLPLFPFPLIVIATFLPVFCHFPAFIPGRVAFFSAPLIKTWRKAEFGMR